MPDSAACKTGCIHESGSWRELRVGGARVGFAPGPSGEGLDLGLGVSTLAVELTGLASAPCSHAGVILMTENGAPVIAEEGPERGGLRVPVTLRDHAGEYFGDGLQEISLLADGTVLLGLGLRVLRAADYTAVRMAGWNLGLGEGTGPAAAAGRVPTVDPRANVLEEVGDWAVFSQGGGFVGVYWGRDVEGWCEKLGGEGLWPKIGDGETAPFFHGWENYLRQWHGPHGWRARETSRLMCYENGLMLTWHAGPAEGLPLLPAEPRLHFSGAVALVRGESLEEVCDRVKALAAPVTPQAEGAAISGFDYLEGSYRFRRTEDRCRMTFPADPLGRKTVVRVDGPPSSAVSCSVNGGPARPQLVSVGRVDDPYGPHEGRPDANGRPVLAQFEKPAERVELGVELSTEKPTVVEMAESKGISLSYLAQDDRRELLLFCDLDERPLGRLSLADLKLRDLRPPGAPRAAVAMLPLYWFLMNAPSRYHSANVLESREIIENGPEALGIRLAAVNPGEKVRSSVEVRLPRPSSDALKLDVSAQLEVLGEFAVPHFQFCNLFPEPSRMPGDWSHAETLAATQDALWVVENREASGKPSTAEGRRFRDFRPPFFLSQYASEGGNFALLVSRVEPAETVLGYELCRCWLDNHLFVTFPEGGPVVGASYRVDYQLALWGGAGTAREEVRELARASLAAGRLEA